ncbi:ABC transporter [Rossellomorea marisflavi]|nr:ABC transporter [Rossellomorea marisflavi]
MSAVVEMVKMNKAFAGVQALKEASFEVRAGEVHALLGANGAGKSTLMKILSGAYEQDEGEIRLNGERVTCRTPKEAKDHGIHCVYQEVDTVLIAGLSAMENILLDDFSPGGSFFIRKKAMEKKAREGLKRIKHESIPLHEPVGTLSLADKQMILLTRCLLKDAKVLILDEPTAPLSSTETEKLFRVIEELKASGVAIIFISHRLPEVFQISDRITVMKDGGTVGTYETQEVTARTIVEAMIGGTYNEEFNRNQSVTGDVLFEASGVSDGTLLKDVSLTVREGEIVGVAGLVGAGKTELAKSLFGAVPAKGRIKLKGKEIGLSNPVDAVRNGLALVPEERRKEGLFVHESIRKNLSFPALRSISKHLWINKEKEREMSREVIASLGIKASSDGLHAHYLSGGNQQKVAIGKWLTMDASLLLFDEPTKGVDVGAKKEIFHLIQSLAEKGKGILYFSCELQEIMAISDRILVMYDGEVVKELTREEATQETILYYASGGKDTREDARLFV